MHDLRGSPGLWRPVRRRTLVPWAFSLLPFLVAAAAAADFRLSDPTSRVYYTLAAAAGEEIEVSKDVRVEGDLHANKKVKIEEQSVVLGNVSAVKEIDNKGTISGSVTSGAPSRPLPALLSEAEARALADRVFEGEKVFENTTIDDVVFVRGKARLRGRVNGVGTIIASNDIEVEKVASGTGPGLLEPSTRLSLIAFQHVKVLDNRSFRGALFAGAEVLLEKDTTFAGVLVGGAKVVIKEGSRVTFERPRFDDATPPSLAFTEPVVPVLKDDPSPEVRLAYADPESGADTTSLRLSLSGQDVTAACAVGTAAAVCQLPALTTQGARQHALEAEVRNNDGGLATASLTLLLVQGEGDVEAPQVLLTEPAAGTLFGQQPVVVRGLVLDDGVVALVTVNGATVPFAGAGFEASVPLFEGENLLTAVAIDGTGKSGETSVTVTLDSTPPALSVLSPAPGLLTNADAVTVQGTAGDASGIVRVTVDGVETPLVGGGFTATVALAPGPRSIVVAAVDRAGNQTTATLEVSRFAVPGVAITSPANLSSTTASDVTIEGTVEGAGVAVVVNGVAAQVSGSTFAAAGVPLLAGPNLVTATATDAGGHAATATITVLRDISEPRLAVASPRDGAVVFDATVTVQGLVSDHGEGALDTPPPAVTVNGVPATVASETFVAAAVPLAAGDNTLTVVATDAAGNTRQVSLAVRRETAPLRRVVVVSGSLQSAPVGSPLPEPLVAQVLDDIGQPLAGRPVLFAARGNDGSFPGGLRQVAVTTDGQGRAATPFTLGMRAGAGNQVVEASIAGFGGPAVFVLTGLPREPAVIVADAGDRQIGAAGQRLPLTLAAAVIDEGANRLAGVPVRFQVVEGGGGFEGGGQEVVVETDHLGRAVVAFRLGPAEGIANNVVEATVVGSDPPLRTAFSASGWIAGDPAATSISGVVLDNSDQPVPGVTLRIKGTAITTMTDDEGLFRIAPAPVDTVELIVDGSTTTRPGSWPDLEFVLTTVPGRDNTVGMPIYLLPLELGQSLLVDETHGGTLTLPDVPGFALDIVPGSVTFPGGGRSGLISVTVVHADKVPMVPNFGQQPRFIITIQPANAIFEPPARLTLPNLDGLPPGAVTEMYSFDHDLGRFVSIGLATVSDDGTVVTSNPGAGVRKAGWHCGGNPSGSGTPHDCPDCKRCVNGRCERDDGQTPAPGPTGDCNRNICWQGTPVPTWDPGDPPPPTQGDCRKEICLPVPGGSDFGPPPPGFPLKVADSSDTAPGKGCCGFIAPDPYDLATQCCTSVSRRIVEKNPMPATWQIECPGRTSAGKPIPPGNGCGSPTFPVPVPENPNFPCTGASFTPACNRHDECWSECGDNFGSCNSEFLSRLNAICAAATCPDPVILPDGSVFDARAQCFQNALAYYLAVGTAGYPVWVLSQAEACNCC